MESRAPVPRQDKTSPKPARAPALAHGAARLLPWAGLVAFAALYWRERKATKPLPPLPAPVIPVFYDKAEPGRGRLAEAPPRIPATGWKDVLWRTWLDIGRDRLNATAGGVTFYTLLAVFPAIGAFVSLWGLFADVNEVSGQLSSLAAFVPVGVLTIIGEQMVRLATARPEALSLAFVVSLFVSIWSANAGMAALFDGLNVVYEEREKRNFFVRRLLTLGFTFAALLFVVMVTGILIAAPIVLRLLGFGESLLVPLRWVLLPLLAAIACAVIYRYGPSRERARWRWVRPGALMAAVGWVAGSLTFSWYLNNFANYDVTYGPLGAVVAFMMWIWVSVMVVLLGAELNAELEHQTAQDSTTGPAQPIGKRGATMADTVGPAFIGVRQQAGVLWGVARRQAGRLRPKRRTAAPPLGSPRQG